MKERNHIKPMSEFKINLQKVIFQNPRAFLEKLNKSKTLSYDEFEKWKDIYNKFRIFHSNTQIPIPIPRNYFYVKAYWKEEAEVIKYLADNFEAKGLRVPIKNLEQILTVFLEFEQYKFIQLSSFCGQPNIKWNLKLLRKIKNISNNRPHEYFKITSNTNIKLNFKIVEEFKDDIKWGDIVFFKELKWTLPKLLRYKNYIKFQNYQEYSANGVYREMGFSLNLKTNWNVQTIDTLSEYWNWSELCLNKYINWDISLINTFIEKVDFEALSSNTHLKWDILLIETFKEKWNWQTLSGNPSLPWSLELLKKYNNQWKWNVEFEWYSSSGNEVDEADTNFHPSISTNTGINWDVKMIMFAKKKLDFWRLARRGNLSLDVIKKIKKELYRKEHTGWVFHKYSDFMTVTEKIFVTGWENLAKNDLFKLNPEIITFLYNNKIELTYSEGNLNKDGEYVTTKFKLLEVFNNSKFINKELMISIIENINLGGYFINNDFINDEIWDKKIMPYTLKNKKKLLNKFEKIKDLKEK